MSEPDFSDRFNPAVAQVLKEATARGGYPALLGIKVEEVTPGKVVCSLAIKEEHHSGVGAVHGGAIASLVDHALSLAVYPLVEPGKWVATTEFKINYLSAAREGTLRAEARVLSLRTRLAVARVDVTNDGTLVALGQGTLYVRDP